MMVYHKYSSIILLLCFVCILVSCKATGSDQHILTPESVQQEIQATPTSEDQKGNFQTRAKDGMRMVAIPDGEFQMGSTESEIVDALALCQEHYNICNHWYYNRESPPHSVSLEGFLLDQTEISNAQYRLCVDAGICTDPTTCKKGEPRFDDSDKSDHPVVCVNWEDAQNYCQWVDARLPTEAEWEYAFRGADRSIYPWGDKFDGTRLNYCDRNCGQPHADDGFDDGYVQTSPVGFFPQGASWSGAYNMGGNVSEWVADWQGEYSLEAVSNPSGPENGTEKMIKGGSWFFHPTYCRGAARASVNPDTRFDYLGFRCARSFPESGGDLENHISASETISITIKPTVPQPTEIPEEVGNKLVFMNSGEFEPARSWDVALGDLDGDGDLDAAISNDEPDGMKIWFNDGQGAFTLGGQILDPALRIALGDLDHDSDLDIVAINWEPAADDWIDGHRDASVWLNDSTGSFSNHQVGFGIAPILNLELGDLNGDDYLDLFFTGIHTNTVWLNDGAGFFVDSGTRLDTGIDAAVALGDLDDDGDLDAMTGGWEGPARVWLNDGLGSFASKDPNMGGSSLHIHGLSLGDFDADGDLDTFAVLANGGPHEVWINDGTGFFKTSQLLSAPLGQGVVVGDIESDGDLDVVTAHGYRSGGQVRVWLNDGAGAFSDGQLRLGDTFCADVALGDLDGDGDLDIFSAHTDWRHQGHGEADRVWLNESLRSQIPSSANLGDSTIRPGDGMKMYHVPAGSFQMGASENDPDASPAEFPQHDVYLDSYWIDETEVTNAQYNQCVDLGLCRQSRYENNASYNGDNFPSVGIDWQDAEDYCDWAGGRLPTEAEWEYAAKGASGLVFPWGNEFDGALTNFCDTNCIEAWSDQTYDDAYKESAPVVSFPGGASWVGAVDMAGNVWEWVRDWCGQYPSDPQINPTGPESGACKIIRGGAWASPTIGIRTTYRIIDSAEISPDIRHPNIGFRCMVPVDQEVETGVEMDLITVPTGSPPIIDGTMTPDEWDSALVETFADGSELYLMQAGDYLYLGIRANTPGMIAGNIFIHHDDQIEILHSSAALGTAIFLDGGGIWQLTQDFDWRCRSASNSAHAQAERDEFLKDEGWLAANSRMGTPNELEYQIENPGEEFRLAVNFIRASNTNEKIVWPAHLLDDCIKLTPGGLPGEMEFSLGQWGWLNLRNPESSD